MTDAALVELEQPAGLHLAAADARWVEHLDLPDEQITPADHGDQTLADTRGHAGLHRLGHRTHPEDLAPVTPAGSGVGMPAVAENADWISGRGTFQTPASSDAVGEKLAHEQGGTAGRVTSF